MKRAILLIGLLLAFDAQAVIESGHDLLANCQNFEQGTATYADGECIGFIAAVSDAIRTGLRVARVKACVPRGVTQEQVIRITVKHLRENPQDLYLSAVSSVARALFEAFPCTK